MIHDLVQTLDTLLGYAHDLTYEWAWKRLSTENPVHGYDYAQLLKAIEQAQQLKIRLEGIDGLKTDDHDRAGE